MRVSREIPRVVGDTIIFFVFFAAIFWATPIQSAVSLVARIYGTLLISIQALLGLYIERAIFYYLVRPGRLGALARRISKGATLFVVNAVLFGILIVAAPQKPPVSGVLLLAFVLFAAAVLLAVQEIGDYIVVRVMAAATPGAK